MECAAFHSSGSLTVSRVYAAAGRVTTVGDWQGNHVRFVYDPNSNLATENFPAGGQDTLGYDAADRLMSINDAKLGSTYASFGYGRDNAGQVSSATSTGMGQDDKSYTYTPLEQLQTASTKTYGYDAADNITQLAGSTTQGYDAAHQMCWSVPVASTNPCSASPAWATTYAYDANGSRSLITPPTGAATSLGYDEENRLTSYGSTATYAYNGDGLRTSKNVNGTTTPFTWAGQDMISDGSTVYIYGPLGPVEQITGTATPDYYHQDQLDSTRVLTDQSGNVVGTSTYDEYGKPTNQTGTATTPLAFAGQYTDSESGMQYLRARYYDPTTAQFISRDPLVASTRSPYGYVQGDPLNATDPSGLFCLE